MDLVQFTLAVLRQRGATAAVEAVERCLAEQRTAALDLFEELLAANYEPDAGMLRSFFQAGLHPNDIFLRHYESKHWCAQSMQHKLFNAPAALQHFLLYEPEALLRVADLTNFVQFLNPEGREQALLFFSASDVRISAEHATALLNGGVSLTSPAGREAFFHMLKTPGKAELALRAVTNCPDLLTPFQNREADGSVLFTPLVVAIRHSPPRVSQAIAAKISKDSLAQIHSALPPGPERDQVQQFRDGG